MIYLFKLDVGRSNNCKMKAFTYEGATSRTRPIFLGLELNDMIYVPYVIEAHVIIVSKATIT